MVSVRGFTFAKCFFSCGVVWCGFNWPRLNWQKGGVTPCHPKLSCCCVWWLVKCQHVLPPWLNIGPGSLRCSPCENERSSESRILCLAQVTRCLEVSSDFWELQKCTATAVFWNFESWRMRLRKGWKEHKLHLVESSVYKVCWPLPRRIHHWNTSKSSFPKSRILWFLNSMRWAHWPQAHCLQCSRGSAAPPPSRKLLQVSWRPSQSTNSVENHSSEPLACEFCVQKKANIQSVIPFRTFRESYLLKPEALSFRAHIPCHTHSAPSRLAGKNVSVAV